ncbi:MAG: hypothetical protein WDZ88_03635 [Candidatus Paceibacterota bacterium]
MKKSTWPLYVVLAVLTLPFAVSAEEANVSKGVSMPLLYGGEVVVGSTTEKESATTGSLVATTSTSTTEVGFSGTTTSTSALPTVATSTASSTNELSTSTASSTEGQKKEEREIVIIGSVVRMEGASTSEEIVTLMATESENGTSTTESELTEKSENVEEMKITGSPEENSQRKSTATTPSPEMVSSWEDLDEYAQRVAQTDEKVNTIVINDKRVAINYESQVKLLGFIPITLNQEISIELQNQINNQPRVKVKFPWWHIFARKDTEVNALKVQLQEGLAKEDIGQSSSEIRKAQVLQVVNTTLREK